MRIGDLVAPYGEFFARAPTSVFPQGSNRVVTYSMQAASDFVASVYVVPVALPLAPAGVGEKNIFPAPAQPLAPLASAGAGQEKHFSLAHPASGTQFEHHGAGNNPFRSRCSNRFGRRGYRQYSPHAYQPTTIFSQRSHGRRFSGVPCSASGSLACSRGQLYPSCGCVPGSTSAAFHLSGPLASPRPVGFHFD